MIRIKRRETFVDLIRNYKIFIDGVFVGVIGSGETRAFEIEDGHHLIHFEIDWCSSKKISLDVTNGKNINLHVGNSMKWFIFPFVYLFYLTILKNRYITVSNESELLENLELKYHDKKEVDLRRLQTITF